MIDLFVEVGDFELGLDIDVVFDVAADLVLGRYANERLGAKHEVVVVPACGHNGRCMFPDNAALGLLFPKP